MTESEEAVRRFLKGDEEAFVRLVREWEGRIYSLAWRMLGNREDAQDAVQDTFISVFRHLKNLRDPGSFPTWIYRIALNQCRAHWRSRAPEIPIGDADPEIPGTGAQIAAPAAGGDTGGLVEIRDLIRKSLMGLSEEHRTAIVLKEYLGLSLEEVAQVMECPLSTAKSRLYHGLRGVQKNLRRLGVSENPHA